MVTRHHKWRTSTKKHEKLQNILSLRSKMLVNVYITNEFT